MLAGRHSMRVFKWVLTIVATFWGVVAGPIDILELAWAQINKDDDGINAFIARDIYP
jgi:hypothetical protein